MPGRVLVVDPVITNRIVLKAQLSAEFYQVELCADPTRAVDMALALAPDAILMRYADELNSDFEICKALHNLQHCADIPILLLAPAINQGVWHNALRAEVDEVLTPDYALTLLVARLEQLIRRKRSQRDTDRKFKTEVDMITQDGLHAPATPVQHAPRKFLTCNVSQAENLIPQFQRDWLNHELTNDFERIYFGEAPSDTADITVIHLGQEPDDAALRRLVELRQTLGGKSQRVLAVAGESGDALIGKLVKLGADDVLIAPFSIAELGLRLRRLGRDLHRDRQVELSVAKRMRQAVRDALTGLYNRRYAVQHLQAMTSIEQADLAVMMLDIDRFKAVNDTFGHIAGDQVLREVARRITSNLRCEDMVARVGGEEFLVVLRDLSTLRLRQVAERLRVAISDRPIELNSGQQITVSVSVGVASASANSGKDAETDLLSQADKALYASKNGGRNQVSFARAAA